MARIMLETYEDRLILDLSWIVKDLRGTYSYFVKVSREDVYIVPPTSM